MGIVLSHTTALEALRSWSLRKRLARGERCVAIAPSHPCDVSAEGDLGSLSGVLSSPVNQLVSQKRAARRDVRSFAHLQSGPLPEGSGVPLSGGVVCASPEQLAVQMAPSLTYLELVFLLSELMGLYAICPAMEDGMFQRRVPLTTPELIEQHLVRLGSRPGTQAVRRALGDACVRSGSPQETRLCLRLGLRPGMGGHNLNVLSMNDPVRVARVSNRMSEGTRKPDVLVGSPDGERFAAIEYHGVVHDRHVVQVQDANRTNELKAMGIAEYVVRKEQYDDLDYMDGLVGIIRRELGYPRIGMTRAEAERRRALRDQLRRELDAIDGVTWDGRARELARDSFSSDPEETSPEVHEEVPLEAYGLE